MTVEEWKRKNLSIQRKPFTNADRIRMMTNEGLADFIMDVQGDVANYYCGNYLSEPSLPTRKEAWLEWLIEESEGE